MIPISFATAAWGSYWNKFGPEFVAAIQAMDPKPAEVVIVTDRDVTLPAGMRHVRPKSTTPMWDWFNEAVAACSTEWIVCVGTDDLWLPDGLRDVTLAGDAVQFAGLEDGQPWIPVEDEYRRFMDIDGNPMKGGTIFKRELFLRYPWRRSVAADWLQWCDLFKAGAKVSFDLRPRFNHRRHDGAHSVATSPVKAESERHVRWMKQLLRTREVLPGDEWPPKCWAIHASEPLRIELGGGSDCFRPGWLNVDQVPEADIQHDLDVYPWPFADDSVSEVYSCHCLEHLDNPHRVLNEVARVCKVGVSVEIRVPHPSSHLAMCHSHKSVISPVQVVNCDTYFPESFWHGPKRLQLERIGLHPTLLLEVAKSQLKYIARLPDYSIMQFVPGCCHESRFFFKVVKNGPCTVDRHARALRLIRGEHVPV